jgi:hypothetical protein
MVFWIRASEDVDDPAATVVAASTFVVVIGAI